MSRIRICLIPLLLIVVVTSVNAQNFREWDRDQDRYITDYEFQVQLQNSEYFKSYDLNADGKIDQTEWDAVCEKCDFMVREYHREWDFNQDGEVDEQEFISGSYREWDSDEDGYIASSEFEIYYTKWGLAK